MAPDPTTISPSFSQTLVFLLKTRSTPHDSYEEYFQNSGSYNPIFVPVLEHRPHAENLNVVKDLFLSGAFADGPNRRYGGLIFTSQRAVEGFMAAVMSIDAASHKLILYTVGPATSTALKSLRDSHFPDAIIYGEEAGNGENLAHLILKHYNDAYGISDTTPASAAGGETKKPALLFLVGEQHRDIIPKTLMSETLPESERIQVDELAVYETGERASFEADFRIAVTAERRKFMIEDRWREGHYNSGNYDDQVPTAAVMWIVVFSPTGCDSMLRVLASLDDTSPHDSAENTGDERAGRSTRRGRRCFIATIGPTTKDYLHSKHGVDPDVCAAKPSPEGVGKGIHAFMEVRG